MPSNILRSALPAGVLFIISNLFFLASSCAQGNTASSGYISLLANARSATTDQKWAEAFPLWEKVIESNPVNGEFHASLGDAAYYTRNYTRAIEAYKNQIDLGFGRTDLAAYNIACCYALQADKVNALIWLDKSIKLGFSNFAHMQTDSDLKTLHGDPEFERLVLRIDASKISRAEGWAYDLDVLQREVDRKAIKGEQFDAGKIKAEISKLKAGIGKLSDNEIILDISRIMRNMGDGHSWAIPPLDHPEFKNTLPLLFYQFKEGLHIIAGDPKYKELLGSQVLEYSGIPVEKFPSIFDPYISRDNQTGPLTRIPYLLRVPVILKTMKLIKDASAVELKIKDAAGKLKTVSVKADTTQPNIWNILPNPDGWVNYPQTLPGPLPHYLKDMKTFHWWELLPDKRTVYCQINRIRNAPNQTFSQFVDRLFHFIDSTGAEKLVIDMRWNNGGNTMLVMPLINAIIRSKHINTRGNLFVIIGRRTFSAAQNTSTYLERFTNPIFVGEPTGSSPNFVGEEEPLVLPYSKTVINVSDLYWQSSWPFDKRTWIAPTIYTPPTFEYFKANRDPSMEAINEYIKERRGF